MLRWKLRMVQVTVKRDRDLGLNCPVRSNLALGTELIIESDCTRRLSGKVAANRFQISGSRQ